MSEESTKKAREPKKNSIPFTEVKELVEGISQYDKASFLVVGHKDGVRIALPKTAGVSRAYFYGANDYSTVPDDEAVRVFSAEERKEMRLGGIMAEVDFSQGMDAARRALAKMIDAVRNAPAPAPKPKREPKARKDTSEATPPAEPSESPTADIELDSESDPAAGPESVEA